MLLSSLATILYLILDSVSFYPISFLPLSFLTLIYSSPSFSPSFFLFALGSLASLLPNYFSSLHIPLIFLSFQSHQKKQRNLNKIRSACSFFFFAFYAVQDCTSRKVYLFLSPSLCKLIARKRNITVVRNKQWMGEPAQDQ